MPIGDRFRGGDSLDAIARDFGLDITQIEEAIRCESRRQAA